MSNSLLKTCRLIILYRHIECVFCVFCGWYIPGAAYTAMAYFEIHLLFGLVDPTFLWFVNLDNFHFKYALML